MPNQDSWLWTSKVKFFPKLIYQNLSPHCIEKLKEKDRLQIEQTLGTEVSHGESL